MFTFGKLMNLFSTPSEGEFLLSEVLAEMQNSLRDEAKAVIKERIREIQILKDDSTVDQHTVNQAKDDFQALIRRPITEIAKAKKTFIPTLARLQNQDRAKPSHDMLL